MPVEITNEAKEMLQSMVAERVQKIIDRKVKYWTGIAIGTATVSVISVLCLFCLVLKEVRTSSKAYATDAAKDEADRVIKDFDLPGKILTNAVTMAQNAAKAASDADYAANTARSTIVKVKSDIEVLTLDRDSLAHKLETHRQEIEKLRDLLEKTRELDTVAIAKKAQEIDRILLDSKHAESLAELLAKVNSIVENEELHVRSLRIGGGTGVFITEAGIFVGSGGLTKDGYVLGTHRLLSK